MNRMPIWGIAAAAALFCAAGGLYFYIAFTDYSCLRDDIDRQAARIETLVTEQSRPAVQTAAVRSVSETVSFISSQIGSFALSEKSIQFEEGGTALDDWVEWRIDAVCIGSVHELNAFIDSLEISGAYHDVGFTMDLNSDGLYELNIGLSFYARHV